MIANQRMKINQDLLDDALQRTWLRIGLAKVALANCLQGREPLDANEIIILSKLLAV